MMSSFEKADLLKIKADFLKTAMQEDRNEIRLIRERIFNTIYFATISSFGITSFLVVNKNVAIQYKSEIFMLIADTAFVSLLLIIFTRLKKDLENARKCLEIREALIQGLPLSKAEDFEIFVAADKTKKARIQDNDLYSPFYIAILAILFKLLFINFR
ncbi:hypothetical protein [Chamaesiphon sp. VAR_69_metabat_338]|uniref:hypothetical protein n=1 Tax=Chamaesiphon sp. VAR_69_metabat_338 TaxID=2964704 RepID=UPI00286D985D|nr:hypothetical protein [Chamaesiphon sp. VAR_69_metabat_338]